VIGGGTGDTNLSNIGNRYVPLFYSDVDSDESDVEQLVPVSATLSNFYVRLTGSPGTGNSYTFMVRRNGDDTSVACTISGGATTCSNTANNQIFNAGDRISIEADPDSGPNSARMRWTATFN
jgi:hypothetical protein